MNILKILTILIAFISSYSCYSLQVRVTNTADSGAGSFRDVIANSQQFDTIIVDVKGTINLSAQIDFNVDDITVIGPFPKHNTFTCNNGYVFNILGRTNLKFFGLGFKNSNVNSVIKIVGSNNIIFESCLFQSNTNISSGTINSSSSFFNVINCSFIQNTASQGAAVYVFDANNTCKIVNSTFWGNNASSHGGAIYLNNSLTLELINNLFYENQSGGVGEAIQAFAATVQVDFYNNVFFGNGSGAEDQLTNGGGAIFNFPGGNVFYENYSGDAPASYFGANKLNPLGPLGIRGNPVTDGYGLVYYTIVDPTSSLIDAGVDGGNLPPTDTRRAPRVLTGTIANVVDAGPVEYTQYRVLNSNSNGPDSFDEALLQVNSSPDSQNYIEFDIVGYTDGNQINFISTVSVDVSVYIDGYSQNTISIAGPNISGGTGVTPAANLIQLVTSTSATEALILNALDITVSGFNIHGFEEYGLLVSSSGNDVQIFGNHIGFEGNVVGSYSPDENKRAGISIFGMGTKVGGNQHWQRNVVSGNGRTGATTFNSNVLMGNTASGVEIYGNFIGAQPDGNTSFAFGAQPQDGIHMWAENVQGNGILVGNPNVGGRNIISGNKNNGIYFSEMGSDVIIDNNYIGLGYDGESLMANGGNGIYLFNNVNQLLVGQYSGNVVSGQSAGGSSGVNIQNCQNTTITHNIIGLNALGTLAKGNGSGVSVTGSSVGTVIGIDNTSYNIISGNFIHGVHLLGGDGTSVSGNYIGIDKIGANGVGNGQNGVSCEYATNSVIGGNTVTRNIISGNGVNVTHAGIHLSENGDTDIAGNYIGTDVTGLIAIGNRSGIITTMDHDTYIGGTPPNQNVISGNMVYGIQIGSSNTSVEGNVIGLTFDMTTALGNQSNGIEVGADNVSIGVLEQNIIAGNIGNGIYLNNVVACDVDRCIIGTNTAFALGLGNGASGIHVFSGNDNDLGIVSSNIIVGHTTAGFAGVSIDAGTSVWIQNNFIGLSSSGVIIPNYYGIQLLNGATTNVIGDLLAVHRNVISGNTNVGVLIDGAGTDNNSIRGNFIGLSTDGATPAPNNIGIQISNGASSNEIGEDGFVVKRNIISANTSAGIYIIDAGTADNVIYKNYIGSDSSNTVGASNTFGIWIKNCSNSNYIGDDADAKNSPVISGNQVGIVIDNSSSQFIFNSRIGTNNLGTASFPNVHGIVIQSGSTNNTIGGNGLQSNLISGNDSIAIAINSCNTNTIIGNRIGTNITGTSGIPNLIGVFVNGGSGNVIGSTAVGESNLISSNTSSGIVLDNDATSTVIKANFIGTTNNGNGVYAGSANQLGVLVVNTSTSNTIGGLTSEGNVFADNTVSIGIDNSSNQHIEGNIIGIAASGATYNGAAAANIGIYLNNSSSITIGSATANHENSIANQETGIYLTYTTGSIIRDNYIGNDLSGSNTLAGGGVQTVGVFIDSASTNNDVGPDNVISGNNKGVRILNTGTSNNQIKSNFIGVNVGGTIALPNAIGVEIGAAATNNIVGGLYSTEKNVISGNTNVAINIADVGTAGNVVSGNLIGIDINETNLLGNNGGIAIFDNASFNIIGGSAVDSANYICDNALGGIYLGTGAFSNMIRGNKIGVTPGQNVGGNGASGIIIDAGNQNSIGGPNAAYSNEIVNNSGDGITIQNVGSNNEILGNIMFGNTGLAIDITNSGATVGPTIDNITPLQNGAQMPIILEAFDCDADGSVEVGVQLRNLTSGQSYVVEFYDNTLVPDASNYGEANVFIVGLTHVAINSIDTVFFNIGNIVSTSKISANLTAINGGGGTSEMALNFEVGTQPVQPVITTVNETCQGANDGSISVSDLANNQAYYFSVDADLPLYNPTFDSTFVLSPGSYNINSKYLNGCVVVSAVQTISLGPIPTFTAVTVDDTCGFLGQINMDGSGNPVGNITNYLLVGVPDITSAGGQFPSLNAGTYQVYITTNLAGVNCVSDTTNLIINSYAMVNELNFVFTDFCSTNNGLVTSQPSFTQGAYSLNPNPGDGSSINSMTGEITNGVQGTQYNVDYTYGTCVFQQTPIAIDVIDPAFTYPDYCISEEAVNSPVNPGGTFSFNPEPADGATIDLASGSISSPVAGTTYSVEYNTGGGCPGVLAQDVMVLDLPVTPTILTLDSVYCSADESIIELSVVGGNIFWYTNASLNNVVANSLTYTPTNISLGSNYFYVQDVDANGCKSFVDSIDLFVSDVSLMSAGEDQEICTGSDIALFATGGETYTWLNLDLDNNLFNPVVGPIIATNYVVTIVDSLGCVIVDSIYVSFLPASECNIVIYTAFSPNNDGVNDTWVIEGIEGFNENTVYFYNRWGDIVNKIENYDNDNNAWDGTNKFTNSIVAPGTYFYIVEAGGINAKNGWVQVSR